MKEADANKLKLTPQFLELKFIEAIANNSKMFFGEKVRCHFPTSVTFTFYIQSKLSLIRVLFHRVLNELF